MLWLVACEEQENPTNKTIPKGSVAASKPKDTLVIQPESVEYSPPASDKRPDLLLPINDSITLVLGECFRSYTSVDGKPFDSTYSTSKLSILKNETLIYTDSIHDFWFYKRHRSFPKSLLMDSILIVPTEISVGEPGIEDNCLFAFLIHHNSVDTVTVWSTDVSRKYNSDETKRYTKKEVIEMINGIASQRSIF